MVLLKGIDVHSHRTALPPTAPSCPCSTGRPQPCPGGGSPALPSRSIAVISLHVFFPLAPPDCPWAAYSGATSSPACEELQPNQPSATTESSLDAPYDIVENLKDLTTAAS